MIKRVRCITINTDASYSNRYEIGTYAFYIVCDFFTIHKGGVFKEYIESSKVAELMSIGNALYALKKQSKAPKTDLIVINTDCAHCISDIADTTNRVVDDRVLYIRSLLTQLKKRLECKISLRHVRAHTGDQAPRSKANEWCDSEAKRWMGIAIIKEQHKLKNHG